MHPAEVASAVAATLKEMHLVGAALAVAAISEAKTLSVKAMLSGSPPNNDMAMALDVPLRDRTIDVRTEAGARSSLTVQTISR
jgi:hypothetical protein